MIYHNDLSHSYILYKFPWWLLASYYEVPGERIGTDVSAHGFALLALSWLAGCS